MKTIGKTKLIQALSLLNAKELSRFQAFVNSPFFNVHEPTTELVNYLLENTMRWEAITKEELFEVLFPALSFQEFKVNNVMSYLMDLFNRFLDQLGFMEDPFASLKGLDLALKRDYSKIFLASAHKMEKVLDSTEARGSDYHLARFQYLIIRHDFENKSEDKYQTSLLQGGLEVLDHYFIKTKLERACELIFLAKIKGEVAVLPFLDKIELELRDNWENYQNVPLIHVYYKCLILLRNPNDEATYKSFANSFESNQNSFDDPDLYTLFTHQLNFCIRKINENNRFFEYEALRIYKQLIVRKLILHKGNILQSSYTNIVAIACKVGEFDWAKWFVQAYASYLQPENRTNALNFNLAYIYYIEKDFETALDLIQTIQFTNEFYQQRTKFLQIRMYYELGEEELLLSTLDSMRILLLRKQKTKAAYKGGLYFIRFSKELATLAFSKSRLRKSVLEEKVERLREKIHALNKPIVNKDWLMEQLEKLKE